MRGRDIQVGQVYAVKEPVAGVGARRVYDNNGATRLTSAVPRTSALRQVTVVDKIAHGILIGTYEALVPDPRQVIDPNAIAARLLPNRKYIPGRKTIRFRAENAICLWEDYSTPVVDGNPDHRVSVVDGRTYTEEKMA